MVFNTVVPLSASAGVVPSVSLIIRLREKPTRTGAPSATPQQCVRFMLARPHGEYTENDIANVIVPAYFALGTAASIDPVMGGVDR